MLIEKELPEKILKLPYSNDLINIMIILYLIILLSEKSLKNAH